MSSKTNIKLAVALTMPLGLVLATASGALGAAKTHATAPNQNIYNPAGAHVGTGPAYGAAARTHTGGVNERSQLRIDDCVRISFPQCSGGN
jgi:hypothetical protein